MCEREGMSPVSCCQRMEKQNPIIFVNLVLLHLIHTPAMHSLLSLTPTLSNFLSPFEVAHVWLHWVMLRSETDCTTLSSTSCTETSVALHGPGAFRGGQPRHEAPANLNVSVKGCGITGLEMQDVKLGWEWLRRCFRHIVEIVLFMPFKFRFLVGYNYASSLPLLCPHPLIKQKGHCNQREFWVIKAGPVILLILQICLAVKLNLCQR